MNSQVEQGQDAGYGSFLWGHLTAKLPTPSVSLTGRTVCVTGGNTGLGYATVLHFARSNISRIIIACRNLENGQAAARKIHIDVPSYRGTVDVYQLDLSSFDNTITFCRKISAQEDRLDFVIANAGVDNSSFKKTGEGYEETIQINGIATALMSLLLLPKMEETAGKDVPMESKGLKPTLVVVGSEVHYFAKFPQANTTGSLIEALNDPTGFDNGLERYGVSKVLSMFSVRELAKLPAITSGKVNVNISSPGLCASGLRDDTGRFQAWLVNAIAWSAEKGTRNNLYAATVAKTPGGYISYCKENLVSEFIVSDHGRYTQAKYWKELMEIFGKLGVDSELDKAIKGY